MTARAEDAHPVRPSGHHHLNRVVLLSALTTFAAVFSSSPAVGRRTRLAPREWWPKSKLRSEYCLRSHLIRLPTYSTRPAVPGCIRHVRRQRRRGRLNPGQSVGPRCWRLVRPQAPPPHCTLEANRRYLKDIAEERLTELSRSVVIPLLQAAVDPELQALWAAVLANAMLESGNNRKVWQDYYEVVRQVEPSDALVLDILGRHVDANGTTNVAIVIREAKDRWLSENELSIALAKLGKLGCLNATHMWRGCHSVAGC